MITDVIEFMSWVICSFSEIFHLTKVKWKASRLRAIKIIRIFLILLL